MLELLRVDGGSHVVGSQLGLRKGYYEVLEVGVPNEKGHCLLTLRHMKTAKVYPGVCSWWFPNGVIRKMKDIHP